MIIIIIIIIPLPREDASSDYPQRKKLTGVKEEWRGLLTKGFEKKLRYMARKSKSEEAEFFVLC